jgi:protein TonB
MEVAGDPHQTLRTLLADKALVVGLSISIGLHLSVLAIRFVDPELLRVRPTDPPLDIVLVNAKSETRPGKPEVLAQQNLDGGGTAERGRRTSPLPNSFEVRDGDALHDARRSVQQLEEEQRRLLAALKETLQLRPSPRRDSPTDAQHGGALDEETKQKLARSQAEIAKQISDYQKRPRKHHYMPSASEYRYARYFEDWRARVEKIGNENYPPEARGRYYGALRMTVAIRKDGSVVDAILEKSSGSPVLDRAARRIVMQAAPYAPFPPDIAKDTDILEITRTWIFTNDQLATRSTDPARP